MVSLSRLNVLNRYSTRNTSLGHTIKTQTYSPSTKNNKLQSSQDVFFSGNEEKSEKYQDYPDLNFQPGVEIINKTYKWAKKKPEPYAPNSIIRNCDFTKSQFERGIFTGTDFTGTIFTNAKLRLCSFNDATFGSCEVSNPLSFSLARPKTNFDHADLCGADFENAKFNDTVSFIGSNLMGAKLNGVDMSKLNLQNALYNSTTEFPADFNPAARGMLFFEDGHELTDKHLERIKVRQLPIKNMKFDRSNFKRADMKDSFIKDCTFSDCIFTRAYLKGVTI